MKLLLHEKILGLITALFLALFLIFSFNSKPNITIAVGSKNAAAPHLVNINTADMYELKTLDGIGPKTAVEIIEFRQKHGNFKTKDELCEVSGIGNSTLNKIKDYIKV